MKNSFQSRRATDNVEAFEKLQKSIKEKSKNGFVYDIFKIIGDADNLPADLTYTLGDYFEKKIAPVIPEGYHAHLDCIAIEGSKSSQETIKFN